MKTTHSVYKYVLALIIAMTATQQLQAQDAFYIYRNDGDFDGFFYDRIVRMGYSKIDLEGEEHDVYVVQEIETSDSLYRIPLAAIDSIGFQQPEIRFSPKLKNMDELGITPYVTEAGSRLGISKSIPKGLLPNVGDVVAGFNSDIYPQNTASGWDENNIHSYVVKITGTSEPLPWYHEDDNSYYFTVANIEDLSEVFDQYITVEDIVVDDQGRAIRRIAGCDFNGMPRRADSGSSSLNLIDIEGTITRSWNPSSDISIDLSAEMGLKVGLHVAYNISWRRAYVKLSRDMTLSAKPSIGFAVSKNFEFQVGDLAKFLKAIPFPASFPIFQTAPLPDWFIRGGGTLEARFTLPKMEFGFGESIIVDTDLPYFPVRYNMYKTVEEKKTEDGIVDVGTAQLKLGGYFQTGLKFSANVETASWLSKILSASISLDLYCGPRIDAEAFNIFNTNDENGVGVNYGEIKVKKLAVDLEAKASAALMWRDPDEKTFFSTEWAFGCDTLYSIPHFKHLEASYSEGNGIDASVEIPNKTFLPYRVGLGMYNTFYIYDENLTEAQKKPHEIQYAEGTCFMGYGPKQATAHFSTEGLRTGTLYVTPVQRFMDSYWPAVSWNGNTTGEIHIPHVLKLSTTSISAPAKGGTYTITYTYSGDNIGVDLYSYDEDIPGTFEYTQPEGDYDPYSWYYSERTGKITINIPPNKSDQSHYGRLRVWTDDYKYNQELIISVSQAAGPYIEE